MTAPHTNDYPTHDVTDVSDTSDTTHVNGSTPAVGGDGESLPTLSDVLQLSDVLALNNVDQVHLTDRGNGRRFVRLFRHLTRYVADTDEWVVRSGTHWQVDAQRLNVFGLTAGVIRDIRAEALVVDDDDVRESMLAYATRAESEQSRWRMLSSAREYQDEIVIQEDDLNHDPDIIATPDGVVNLLTGEWRPAVADDLCTTHTLVTYDPDATSPLLDQFLDTFVPDPENQEVLFAILGTIIRGGNPTRIFPVFLGGTTSGKSQIISALARLFGDYMCSVNASVFRGNLDDKPRPDLARAMTRRVAYAVETSKSWELHADQIKRLTGGSDPIPYRTLYGKSQEKIPTFTPLVITNEMPRIKGADQALRRRMLTFHFDQTLPPEKEDTRIKELFTRDVNCLRALLARVVAGARSDMMRNGIKWTLLPQRYAGYTLDSFAQLDHVGEFLEWLTDREILVTVEPSAPASHCARANEMHEWYVSWVQKHGNKQDKSESLNMKEFGQVLRERGWVSKTSGGVRWLGVRLTTTPSIWVS